MSHDSTCSILKNHQENKAGATTGDTVEPEPVAIGKNQIMWEKDEEQVLLVREKSNQQRDEEECDIERLALYRLDYEDDDIDISNKFAHAEQDKLLKLNSPKANGGEVLQPGDHVYMWCTLYQHHGIVLKTFPAGASAADDDDDDATSIVIPETTPESSDSQKAQGGGKDEQKKDKQLLAEAQAAPLSSNNKTYTPNNIGGSILIAEFTNAALAAEEAASIMTSASTAAGAASGGGVTGGFRMIIESTPHLKWHKVKYQANSLECLTWRPGTCSGAKCLSVSDILTRVHFLHECRHLIPDYHLFASNCETVAVWCVTGKWETLQGDRVLQLSALGAAAAATSMAPLVIPVGMALAATSGGLALWRNLHIGKQWVDTAVLLNQHYKWFAMGKTPSFSFQATTTTDGKQK